MNKKKIFIDVFVIIILFVLFVLWYENRYGDIVLTSSSMNDYTVYLITTEKADDFGKTVNQGASDMAKLLGLDYKWVAPQERNSDEQITIFNNAVSAGADAIMISAIDPAKISEAIKDAKTAGVKIVYIDSPANEDGIITLATDDYEAGVTSGENMINELGEVGIKSGSIGIVNVSKKDMDYMNLEKGFRDAIKADGRFILLDTKYTMGNETIAREASEAFINDNPDLVGLFGTNENITLSIGNAIKNSKKPIIGIGYKSTAAIREMIKAGYIKAVMVENPYTMGYLGMAEALAALKEYGIDTSYIDTGIKVITEFSH
ncbi:MAG TPA: substrate-binding domain-containing protein [Mobilitalea sp.]|nr:substrate-binding domain-containing protein [Mobilitalea sp.]